jgi:hypothetical protein
MLSMMLISHLLSDYLFQFNCIARWKARSLWGVVAHGGIVTLTTLGCAWLIDPAWWPYALVIGVTHTIIDIAKVHYTRPQDPQQALAFYMLDQALHILVILALVQGSQGTHSRFLTGPIPPHMLTLALGYLLLFQPAWVLLRFIVRGIWGADAAPPLGAGEKFAPMLERAIIASLVLAGQMALVPLVLLPRRLTSVQMQSNGHSGVQSVGVWISLTTHWAETCLSVLLAVSVGLALRIILISS